MKALWILEKKAWHFGGGQGGTVGFPWLKKNCLPKICAWWDFCWKMHLSFLSEPKNIQTVLSAPNLFLSPRFWLVSSSGILRCISRVWKETMRLVSIILVPSTSHFVIWSRKKLELTISIHWLNWLFFSSSRYKMDVLARLSFSSYPPLNERRWKPPSRRSQCQHFPCADVRPKFSSPKTSTLRFFWADLQAMKVDFQQIRVCTNIYEKISSI